MAHQACKCLGLRWGCPWRRRQGIGQRRAEQRYDESATLAFGRRVASVDQCSQPAQTDRHAVAKSFMLITAAQHNHFATARVWQHERTNRSTDSVIVPCQNKFGKNARLMGGSFGLAESLASATEHQANDSPHIHGIMAVVTPYQYSTLAEIRDLITRDITQLEAIKHVHPLVVYLYSPQSRMAPQPSCAE